MKNKTFLVILMMLVMCVLSAGSVFAQFDIIKFTLGPPTNLQTSDPNVPVTWQATIQNIDYQWKATGIGYGFTFLNPTTGLGSVTFNYTLPPILPSMLMPLQTWTGTFAWFDFNDDVPIGSTQEIKFSVFGYVEGNPNKEFKTQYQIGSATLVPEPSSLLLLGAGLLGFVGYGVIRRKKE